MKIGILTHPLGTNYGCLMQNYALQKVLKDMGNEVFTINIKNKFSYSYFFERILIYIIKVFLCKKNVRFPLTYKQIKFIRQNTDRFINKYISTTEPLIWVKKRIIRKYNFEAYIVGSDQVWHPGAFRKIEDMFFDFLKDYNVKKISYAASFAVDEWLFTSKQTAVCSSLIKDFDAVSVREDSGVELCNKFLNVKAEHVLDPTMLLSKDDYIALLPSVNNLDSSNNQLTVYMLDQTDKKKKIIDTIARQLNLEIRLINNIDTENMLLDYKKRVAPPVENWIEGFRKADFVVTDSFHGTVFSLIFNKQFIAIGNKKRGITRFQSLLRPLGLENRILVEESLEFSEIIKNNINYKIVNHKVDELKDYSYNFLITSLK